MRDERHRRRAAWRLAALGKELVLCGGKLATLPVAFDREHEAYDLEGHACLDVVRHGPLWALVQTSPQELVRIEPNSASFAKIVARIPLPGPTTWRALLR